MYETSKSGHLFSTASKCKRQQLDNFKRQILKDLPEGGKSKIRLGSIFFSFFLLLFLLPSFQKVVTVLGIVLDNEKNGVSNKYPHASNKQRYMHIFLSKSNVTPHEIIKLSRDSFVLI